MNTFYQVETKNQVSGMWTLYEKYIAQPEALAVAADLNRKRPMPGMPVVAFIETRIVEVAELPEQNPSRQIIWENGESCEKADVNRSDKT